MDSKTMEAVPKPVGLPIMEHSHGRKLVVRHHLADVFSDLGLEQRHPRLRPIVSPDQGDGYLLGGAHRPASPKAREREASHASMPRSGHAIRRSPSTIGWGNFPFRRKRYSVALDN